MEHDSKILYAYIYIYIFTPQLYASFYDYFTYSNIKISYFYSSMTFHFIFLDADAGVYMGDTLAVRKCGVKKRINRLL